MATIKKGSYRFNEILDIESADNKISGNLPFSIPYQLVLDDNGITIVDEPLHFNLIYITYNPNAIHYGVTDSGLTPQAYYFGELGWDSIYYMASYELGIDNPDYKGYGRTINVTEDTEVDDTFATWFEANTEPVGNTPAVSITYKGDKIELYAGDVATLHIKDHKLTEDLVVKANATSGGSSECTGNIVPLYAGYSGTYDENSPVLVTETFTGEGEPDAEFNYWGTSISYFKAKKLVATNGIFNLLRGSHYDKFNMELEGETIPLGMMELNRDLSETSVVLMSSGLPMAIWVIATDESYLTKEAGFEDGWFYIADVWTLAGFTDTLSITSLGVPDKPADGFSPVNVEIPLAEELVLDGSTGLQLIDDGTYYRKIKIRGLLPKTLSVVPSTQTQTFYPEEGWFFSKVEVQPMDLSDLSDKKVPCGIYLDPIPKTEYVVGERLDVSGSYVVRMYTNGEKTKVNLLGSDIDGWADAYYGGVGTYVLTVNYEESGIKMQTTYRITVTEA